MRHVRVHCPGVVRYYRYQCPGCYQLFTRPDVCRRHIARRHGPRSLGPAMGPQLTLLVEVPSNPVDVDERVACQRGAGESRAASVPDDGDPTIDELLAAEGDEPVPPVVEGDEPSAPAVEGDEPSSPAVEGDDPGSPAVEGPVTDPDTSETRCEVCLDIMQFDTCYCF